MRLPRTAVVLLPLLGAGGAAGHAQDAHYWTHQYGTRATLLGGAVIGSVLEVSATFYNPGALSLLEDAALIATSRVIEYSRLELRDRAAGAAGLSSDRFDLAPGFFGGVAPFRPGGRHAFGYSGFTRHRFTNEMISAGTSTVTGPAGAGSVTVGALLELSQDLNESWYGATWGYRVGRRSGIGVSTFVTYRSQRGLARTEVQAADDQGNVAVIRSERFANVYHYGMLLKGGVAWEWLGASLGLTVTTPRLGLFGSGDVRFNSTLPAPVSDPPVAAVTYQFGLPVTFKSSWAIGAGGSKRFGATRLHVSGEWFAPVESFRVVETAPFTLQPSGDTLQADVFYSLESVFNVGVGVEHALAPWLTGFASFQTNFSARPDVGANEVTLASWDAYYLTAGTAFRFRDSDVTVGLSYGVGGDDVPFATVPPVGDPATLPEAISVGYRTLRFLVAFSL